MPPPRPLRFERPSGRRHFLAGAAASILALRPRPLPAAADRFNVAVMGVRGRGRFHCEYWAGRPDVRVTAVCDVDSRVAGPAADAVEKISGARPKVLGDFRRILDDPEIHVLVNATPDHWHALPTILACQAGKDVYVEKPASHCVFEGRQMAAAARKYNRAVQLGTQTRGGRYARDAEEYIRGGGLGKVHRVRVVDMKAMGSIGRKASAPAPDGVDYDMWLGAAPARPFNPNRFHDGWNWFWDYSGGDVINDTIHQIDVARWFLGEPWPLSVSASGGKFHFDDDQECPDTLSATVNYASATMTIEVGLWTPYQTKVDPADREKLDHFPDWRFCGERIEVFGDKGMMFFGRHGIGWQAFGPGGAVSASGNGPVPLAEHVDDFLAAVRDRRRPCADIEEGHRSTVLAQLANISYRCGGRLVKFDGAAETIPDDPEAAKMLKREYRAPWAVPDAV